MPEKPFGVGVSGNHAFVGLAQGIQVVDISIPDDPQLGAFFPDIGAPRRVTVSRDLAFVAHRDGELGIVDISDPQSLSALGSIGSEERFKYQSFEVLNMPSSRWAKPAW